MSLAAEQIIQTCINVCRRAADHRGRWRTERWCARALDAAHPDSDAKINAAIAAAARRLGAQLAAAPGAARGA